MKEKDNLNHEDVAGPEEFVLMELRSQPEEMIPKQRLSISYFLITVYKQRFSLIQSILFQVL